jgi:surfeit locus 1 family protein
MRVKLAKQIFALNTLWLIITLTAFTILINLSWWQLTRAAEKEQQLAQLAQLNAAGGLLPSALGNMTADKIDGAPLQGYGTWLAPHIWLLDNQVVNGRVGYDVIVPVRASGLEQPLLVNLGWLAATERRELLPEVVIAPELQLNGLLRVNVAGAKHRG